MATTAYHFITHWRVSGTVEEVAQLLADARDLVRWWPSVYLDAEELQPGDEHGIGRVINLYTKGWLPYTLRWQFRVTESDYPHRFALEAKGDFVGRGVWTFEQKGSWVDVTYDWKIRAAKPLLRYTSFLLKPIFSANHRWAMAKGEQSLKLELARRRAATPEERARIPPPPGPTFRSLGPFLAGAAAGSLICLLARRRPIRRRWLNYRPRRTEHGPRLPKQRAFRRPMHYSWRSASIGLRREARCAG